MLGMLSQFLSEPRVLSNEEIRRFLMSMRPLRRPNLTQESQQLLDDAELLIDTLLELLETKNADEKIQKFVYHALYAAELQSPTNKIAFGRISSFWHVLLNAKFQKAVYGVAKLLGDLAPPVTSGAVQAPRQPLQPQPQPQPTGGPYAYYRSQQGEPMQYQGDVSDLRGVPVMADGGGVEIPAAPQSPSASTSPRQVRFADEILTPGIGVGGGPTPMKRYTVEQQQQQQQQQLPKPTPAVPGVAPAVGIGAPTMMMAPPQLQQQQHRRLPAGYVDVAARFRQPLPESKLFEIVEEMRDQLRSIAGNEDVLQSLKFMVQTVAELGSVSGYEFMDEHDLTSYMGIRSPAVLLRYEENRKAMMNDLKAILETFANDFSLNQLIAVVDQFQLVYQSEWEYRDLSNEIGTYLERGLRMPRYLESDDFIYKGADLIKRMRRLLGEQHPDILNTAYNELFGFVEGFRSDPITTQLFEGIRDVKNDLLIDPNTGSFTLKAGILHDLRESFIPAFVSSLRYIPLPRIEVSSEEFDLLLDNVVLSGANIIPNLIEFRVENELQLSPRPELPNAYFLNIINFAAYQIEAGIRNVEFAYRKKSFPRFEDVGLANFVLGGNGLCIRTKTALDTNLPYTTLVPLEIEVTIDQLRIELLESHHPMLYRVFGKTLNTVIKRRICLAIETQIYNAIRRMDAVVTRSLKAGGGGLGAKGISMW